MKLQWGRDQVIAESLVCSRYLAFGAPDCSQKLLPRRGVALLSGAQQILGSVRNRQLYRKDRVLVR
jgi:hypothetical protein